MNSSIPFRILSNMHTLQASRQNQCGRDDQRRWKDVGLQEAMDHFINGRPGASEKFNRVLDRLGLASALHCIHASILSYVSVAKMLVLDQQKVS